MNTRRVWCEAGDLDAIARDEILEPLARRDIELIAAVFPSTMGQVEGLLDACERAYVRVSLWPMLDDERGRWANAATMEPYAALVRALLDQAAGRPVWSVFVDLEPPIDRVRAALRAPWRLLASEPEAAGASGPVRRATEELRRLADEARGRKMPLSAAALPLAVLPGGSGGGWQRALGVPLDTIEWEAVQVMVYSSLFEGYSGGLLGRAAALDLVGRVGAEARAKLGPRAGLSLGVVGPGALGDERPLSGVAALRQDVAAALAAGIEDLALFDLLGALARPPLSDWLDALVDTEPQAAERSRAAAALGGACWLGGRLLAGLVR